MKLIPVVFILVSVVYANAQDNKLNVQNNYGAGGYDLVAFFKEKATKGNDKYELEFKGIIFRFSSEQHLLEFKKSPEKYLPQYGGWCAYAMATEGEKVKINPKTFEIRNGKLYLFYDAYFNNTLDSWLEEGPDVLINQANHNWSEISGK